MILGSSCFRSSSCNCLKVLTNLIEDSKYTLVNYILKLQFATEQAVHWNKVTECLYGRPFTDAALLIA